MSDVIEALKQAKKCLHCGGYLEPKFGDYHPYCKTLQEPTGALAAKIAEERMEERAKESSQEDEQILKAIKARQSEREKIETEINGYKLVLEEYIKLNDEKRKQLKEARECINTKFSGMSFKKIACLNENCKNTACPLNEKEKFQKEAVQ